MTIKKSANPYLRGMRPKKFFSGTVELNKQVIRMKDIRTFNPDWSKKVRA